MQQRQLRLGDILDDYCPRERRLTNHAVVAMVGPDVKQTRCTTCDAEHDYKHAKVPRQRKKSDSPAALYAQVLADGPKKKRAHEPPPVAAVLPQPADNAVEEERDEDFREKPDAVEQGAAAAAPEDDAAAVDDDAVDEPLEEGPVHRPLIRAQLPRIEGQPPTRPAPDFTIRQPAGRTNRFRPRHPRGPAPGGSPSHGHGNRPGGNASGGGPMRSGSQRQNGGRPPTVSRLAKHHGPGRKRSK
jgi:hypothetical protein